ncbi:MAG: SHOCT domain-containing protein [Promethearchaeota archaeon]
MQQPSNLQNNKNEALDILKARLAKGEISKEEYYKMKEILEE